MGDRPVQATAGMVVVSLMLGFMGIFTRYLGEHGLDSTDIAFVRASVTVVIILPVMVILYRKDLRPRKEHIPIFVIFGLCRFGTDVTLFYAQQTVTLALATLLQMTFPYYVMIISLFVFKERINVTKLASVMLGFFGATLITGVIFGNVGGDAAGIFSALLSGLLIGLYLIGCGIGNDKGIEPLVFLFYAYIVSAVAGLPFTDLGAVADVAAESPGILFILGIGLLMTVIPEFMTVWSTKHLRPTTVSIICVLELVAAVGVGAAFYGEDLDLMDLFGVILVTASVIILNIRIKFDAKRLFGGRRPTLEEIRAMSERFYRYRRE